MAAEQKEHDFWLDVRAGAPERSTRSIVGWANDVWQKSAPSGVQHAPDVTEREPDGYLRQTPVQPVQDCPGYHARMARRIIFWLLVAAAAVTAYYLIVSGIIRL